MSTSTAESSPDGAAPGPGRPGLSQPVPGVVSPQLAEATIRTVWPSVTAASPAAANLARPLIRSIVLAPLGWVVLIWPFVKRLLFVPRRYALTNHRLLIQVLPNIFSLLAYPLVYLLQALTNRRRMVQHGLKAKPKQEVALSAIDDVRLVEDSYNPFYRSATLEVLSGGNVVLTLPGVPEPEAFRQSILNALFAWVPGKSRALPMIPASATEAK